MEDIIYRYRYQARRTCLLLVDRKEDIHIADGLYDGPASDLGHILPVKWDDDWDNTAFEYPLNLPDHFRVVAYPANESEEKDEKSHCLIRNISDIQTWADVELGFYDPECDPVSEFYVELIKKMIKKPKRD